MTDKVFISKENLEKALSFKEKKDVGFFTSIFIVLIGFTLVSILKKRKRSAKSIYKLIDDLEKKYIY